MYNIKNYSILFLAYVMVFHAKGVSSHLPPCQGTHDFHAKQLSSHLPSCFMGARLSRKATFNPPRPLPKSIRIST